MIRWSLLFALPIVACAVLFQALLVNFEDATLNFLSFGHTYGAPFVVGAGRVPTAIGETAPPYERISVIWFTLDVVVTAVIALGLAWLLRVRNAWPPSMVATTVVVLGMRSSPPFFVVSFGFSYWVYWLLWFAVVAAVWAGLELFWPLRTADRSGRRSD